MDVSSPPQSDRPTRHRRQGSRRRRWSREMLGLYIGLPLVFVVLALSIGIIEYRPLDPGETQRARADKQRQIDQVGYELHGERLVVDVRAAER